MSANIFGWLILKLCLVLFLGLLKSPSILIANEENYCTTREKIMESSEFEAYVLASFGIVF